MTALSKAKKVVKKVYYTLFPQNETDVKEHHEFLFWQDKKNIEGKLSNSHYEYFYTEHFGIEKSSYDGKILMDLGCGPRGSLEWADNAKKRIGVDPLADRYVKELGADAHNMEYISCGSEKISVEDSFCDYIFSFNSLDHVEDVEKSLNEVKRCLSQNGSFLLLVEVNHPPTKCEPHILTTKILVDMLSPELITDKIEVFKPNVKGLYASIVLNDKFEDPYQNKEVGWFSAKFVRR